MTARELLDELSEGLRSGRIDPDAIVVRPLCMCDEVNGWVEAQFLDRVARKKMQTAGGGALFMSGSGAPEDGYTHDTLKLG